MNFIKKNAAGIAELLISIILTVGVFTLFKACGLHEGKAMACHWAENTVKALGIAFITLSAIRLIVNQERNSIGICSSFCSYVPGSREDYIFMHDGYDEMPDFIQAVCNSIVCCAGSDFPG